MQVNDVAEQVLSRFDVAIRTAVSSLLTRIDRRSDTHLRDELTQDARIRVITFAGLMPGWQSGKLWEWERIAEGDEHQVSLLLTRQLRLALMQGLGRQPSPDGRFDDDIIDHLSRDNYDKPDDEIAESEYRERYPILASNVFDGDTQQMIANRLGVDERTVRRHIAAEKRAFLSRHIREIGGRVNGDEPLDTLTEKYARLTVARPSEPVRSNQTGRTGHRPYNGKLWRKNWKQEHCLDCNEPCSVQSADPKKICTCCRILANGGVYNG